MEAKTVYRCPACNEEHDTKLEASRCYKSFEDTGLRVGDLVVKSGKCWRILDISSGMVALGRVNEFVKLKGFDIHKGYQERAISVQNRNCQSHYRKLLETDIETDLQRRRMQVKCGETLLGELKCRSGESFTPPGLKEPSVSLKQLVLKSGQKPATKRATKPGTKSTRRTKSR